LILILTTKMALVSDYQFYYDTALCFAKQVPFVPGEYMIGVAPNTLSYISFLGGVFRVFGESLFVGLLFNLFFTTFSVWLLFLCGRKLMDKTHAFVCALLYALSPSTFLYSLSLAIEPLAMVTFLLGLYGFFIAYEKKKPFHQGGISLLAGMVLGYSNEVRSNAIALLVALVVFLLFFSKKKPRERGRLLLSFLAGFLLVKGLYGFYQQQVFQTSTGITFGWALYEGLDINTFGGWSKENSQVLMDTLKKYPPQEVQKVLLQKAFERGKGYTASQWLTLFLGKGMNMWAVNGYSVINILQQGTSPWLKEGYLWAYGAVHIPYWLLMGGFTFSTIAYPFGRWRKKEKKEKHEEKQVILTMTILALVVAHSFITSIDRYHYGIIPIMMLLLFSILSQEKKTFCLTATRKTLEKNSKNKSEKITLEG
ncbi:MAG: hypothetical protein GX786_03425, partial [Clostridiales bacterium]|nr:hypothetical protein [Clostridiales bacterium]